MKTFITIILVLASIAAIESKNYCDLPCYDPMTKKYVKNIGCDNDGSFDRRNCPANTKVVDMINKLKDVILSEHNRLRNLIAGGGLTGFKPACRMATMEWDDNLASQAVRHAKQCLFQHDKCRRTVDFEYPGQNVAYAYESPTKIFDDIEEFKARIQSWFNEYENCTQSIIDRFPSVTKYKIGHFTQIVVEKNIRVGCAAVKYDQNETSFFRATCNYATGNAAGFPIYEICNKAAEKCTTGPNRKYPNLCSTKEFYDVNKFY